MIHMPHNGDHRVAGVEALPAVRFSSRKLLMFKRDPFHFISEFACHQRCHIRINGLIDIDHHADIHQFFNQLPASDAIL